MFLKCLAIHFRRGTRTAWWAFFFVSATTCANHAALAQSAGGADPSDVAGTRPQPAYDALGIRLGSFLLYPTLSISGTYDSNVFARSVARQSDTSVTLVPALSIRQSDPDQGVTLNADARFRRYASLHSQDDDQYRVAATSRIQIGGDTLLSSSLGWARATASRGTYENDLKLGSPLYRDGLNAGFSIQHSLNRLTARAGVSAEKFDFDDVRLSNGGVIDQSYRNGRRIGGSFGLSYQLGARLSAQVQGTIDDYDYEDSNPLTSRDSSAYSITAGGRYELTNLLFLELGVGVRKYNFKNALFDDYSGLALNGRLRWYPTPLLSVRFDLSQTTSTSSSALVTAVQVTSGKLDADYELKRNLILSTGAELSWEDYGSLQGKSTFVAVNARLNWKLNRWLRLGPSVSYQTRRGSSAANSTFDAFRVSLAVTLAR